MAHLDKVAYSNLSGTYLNYRTLSVPLTVSGSVTGGGGIKEFIATFVYDRSITRADVFLVFGSYKVAVTSGNVAYYSPGFITYQYAGGEITSAYTYYDTSSSLQVSFEVINNTGGTINLITQTVTVEVVLYDAPFA